jgi:hypothetical protein
LQNQTGVSPMGAVTVTGPGMQCFSGANFSTTVTFTLSAWHLLQCHIDATPANCYASMDGGTHAVFTCANTGAFNEIKIDGNSAATSNTSIADVYINTAAGGGLHPSMLMDMSAGANAGVPTVTTLVNSSHCGNGVWTLSPTTLTTFTFDNTQTKTLPGPELACGQTYFGNTGLSLKETLSATTESITYAFLTNYVEGTVGFFYYTTESASTVAKQDEAALFNASGGFVIMYTQSTGSVLQMCIEQSSTGTGNGCTNIVPNQWYWVTMEILNTNFLALRVFDGTTFLPLGPTLTGLGSNASLPAQLVIGTGIGAISGTQNGAFWISDVLLDYANASFSLLPTGISYATIDTKSTVPAGSSLQ